MGLAIFSYRASGCDLRLLAEFLGNIGSFAVPIVGGAAALWWWRQRGSGIPRLKIEQQFTELTSSNDGHVLYVRADLQNVGEVPLTINKWCLWVTRLVPVPEGISQCLAGAPSRVCRDFRLPWEAVAGEEFEMRGEDAPFIAPGETQDLGALLLIPSGITAVRVYSFIPHSIQRHGKRIARGWTNITVVRLGPAAHGGT